MPPQVLKDVGIWISGEDFAGVSNAVGVDLTMDTPESTNFASAGWREYEGGLKVASFTLDGFFDADHDEAQFAALGTEKSALVVPVGQDAGDLAYVVPVAVSAHSVSGSIGDLLAFTYAAEGDGPLVRAQVFDIRENVAGPTQSTRLRLGAVPSGQTLYAWVHVLRNAGAIEVKLVSSPSITGPVVTRATLSSITGTGLVLLSVDGPVTDAFWFLDYSVTGVSDFDIAAASAFAAQMAIAVPPTPVTPPTPTSHALLGGVSADAIPMASELTIVPNTPVHNITIPAIANMHILFARDDSQSDITSIVDTADPTNQNQIGGWTKYGSTVTVGGTDYNVWVSNFEITTPGARTFDVR